MGTGRQRGGALVVGSGPPVLLCPGFSLRPRTYAASARRLGRRATIVVPDLFATGRRWDYAGVLADLERLLDDLGLDRVTLVGHSFGGGVALGLAARRPGRCAALVVCNSLGASRQWELAREALWGTNVARLATRHATGDFLGSALLRSRRVAGAGWWAFRADKAAEMAAVRSAPIGRHVVWTARDTLLGPAGGARFAADLDARFTLVDPAGTRGSVDHDWVYRHPDLFDRTLAGIGVVGPAGAGRPAGRGTARR